MHVVVIGGSDAGISAVLRIRELDTTVEVTVVVADAFPNFSICGIPYYISGEVQHGSQLAHRSIADLEATGMRLMLDTRAVEIDPANRRVRVQQPEVPSMSWATTPWSSAPARYRCCPRSTGSTGSAPPMGCTSSTPWATPSPSTAP